MKRNQDGTRNSNTKTIERRPNGTKRVYYTESMKTRTQQQFKNDCDVNQIVAKFRSTGTISHLRNSQNGVYVDLTTMPVDLMAARQIVLTAEAAFNEIPAQHRQFFGHDPVNMINFLSDPANDEQAIKMGLKVRPAPAPKNEVLDTLKEVAKNTSPKKPKTEE